MVDCNSSAGPVVTKVAGATITAKKTDINGSIDLKVNASDVRVMMISYASFTITVV